jgi:hypothetical protein
MTFYAKYYPAGFGTGTPNCDSNATTCGPFTAVMAYDPTGPGWRSPDQSLSCGGGGPSTPVVCTWYAFLAQCGGGSFGVSLGTGQDETDLHGGYGVTNCLTYGGRMPAVTSVSATPFMVTFGTPGVIPDAGTSAPGCAFWLFVSGVLTG